MNDTLEIPAEIREPKRRARPVVFLTKLFREKPLGAVGRVIVLLMLFTGIFAEYLAPEGYNVPHLPDRMSPPSTQYILGTDALGRDILSRIIYGARISMIVGLAGAALQTGIGTILGILCGLLGGKFDLVVQRFVDAWMCFPWIFIVLTIMALVGHGMVQVILVLGFLWGIINSRVIRGTVLGIKENLYVQAAVATGCTKWRIIIRHILPNIMAPIVILYTVSVGGMILGEAMISFLGYGIPPPQPSWGGMLSGQGRTYMLQAPWIALWPGFALSISVYGVNIFGDALRDLLDPRLRGGQGGRYYGVFNN